ncbi:MAG: acetate--CoA ligase family protein [Pseudomonadota bacterium]
MIQTSKEIYKNLFHPESIAVIGASNDPLKPGGRVIKNITENGYKGLLWAINQKDSSIMNLPTFQSVENLPAGPDLALIIIPASAVLRTLKALADKNTKAAMIMTAGFGEKGEEGRKLELEMLGNADAAGMTIIGPNCSGFLTPVYSGKFAGIIPRVRPGAIDFISGSGATVDFVMELANGRGLVFSNVVNLGNSIQMGVEDILALMDENHGPQSAKIILLYVELIKKPEKLLFHARSLYRKGCTLVGIKSGVSEAGAKAAASHTGAIARPDNAVQALFDKAGIIRVSNRRDLITVAGVLSAAGGPIQGNRICVITDAGGPGVMICDELSRQGLVLPTLKTSTQQRLLEILPPEASAENPIDCLPTRNAKQVREIFNLLSESERDNLDAVVFIVGNSGMSDNWSIYQEVMTAMDSSCVPVIPVLSSVSTCADILKKVVDSGKVYFPDETAVAQALGKIIRRPSLSEPSGPTDRYDLKTISETMLKAETWLNPEAVKTVLSAAGFLLPLQVEIYSESGIEDACRHLDFPLVMKVIGPLHKSDMGGVKVGIHSPAEATNAWWELIRFPGVSGVLAQRMVTGTEVILGAVHEEGFGHLIMFGLGGIHTEVLKDVTFALAPLSNAEALEMVQGIRSFPLLGGVRGQQGLSVDILVEYLVRLSRLVTDCPQIREIDLNPIKGTADTLYVVDARILIA